MELTAGRNYRREVDNYHADRCEICLSDNTYCSPGFYPRLQLSRNAPFGISKIVPNENHDFVEEKFQNELRF